jgi:insertion element IS1 protein InsB
MRKRWIWIAIHRLTKQVLCFAVGGRNDKTCKRFIAELKQYSHSKYCSDAWDSYAKFLCKSEHIISKAETYTIEGFNSVVRHFLKRFCRKTKCYSKSEDMIECSLNLLFHSWNCKKAMEFITQIT